VSNCQYINKLDTLSNATRTQQRAAPLHHNFCPASSVSMCPEIVPLIALETLLLPIVYIHLYVILPPVCHSVKLRCCKTFQLQQITMLAFPVHPVLSWIWAVYGLDQWWVI